MLSNPNFKARIYRALLALVAAASMLSGCTPNVKPAPAEPPRAPMTLQQEIDAWCALKLYGPGMAGWCER